MITTNYSYQPTYFKGRCVEIRDCDWAIRTFHRELPHFSTSKFQPLFIKFIKSKKGLIKNTKQINTNENILKNIVYRNWGLNKLSNVPVLKNYLPQIISFIQEKLGISKVLHIKGLISNIDDIRDKIYNYDKGLSVHDFLKFLKEYRLGNCSEEATVMELILKMNGIKNACTASLKSGREEVDHLVCVFNRDGSPFRGKVTNSTIIVDPWAGKADFAKNLLVYYRNVMTKSLSMLFNKNITINPETRLGLKYFEEISITPEELEELKKLYPRFIFDTTKRQFMQKICDS